MTSPICCGDERVTPFCPICGKQLALKSATIDGLLAHIRDTRRSQQTRFDTMCRGLSEDPGDNADRLDRRKRYLEKWSRAVTKWEAWESQLIELIQKASDTSRSNVPLTPDT